MKKFIEIIKKNRFLITIIFICFIKIIIVEVQPIEIKYTMKYDDKLMVDLAENIARGKWLGEYNKFTLIKGVFPPLFLAFTYLINIPFLLAKEILYGLACIIFVQIIKKKIPNKICLYIIYIVILFNPVEYSSELCRVYRDGLYMSLIMFFISFFIGIFINRKEPIIKQIKYYIGFGISFSAVYFCREDFIWIMPFLVIGTIINILLIILDKKLKNKVKRITLYVIPLTIFIFNIIIVCSINYKYYGVFQLNQYWSKEFKSAYGALTRVIPEEEIKTVPVTRETIKRVYEISPAFAELEEFIEGDAIRYWSDIEEKDQKEISGAYFHWLLMQAAESKGYYKDAKTANEFYIKLAKEVNYACDNGLIKAIENIIVSNTCRYDFKDLINIMFKMPFTIKYEYCLEDIKIRVKTLNIKLNNGEEANKIINKFEKMTHNQYSDGKKYKTKFDKIRIRILQKNKDIYKNINKKIIYISIMSCILFLIFGIFKIKEYYEELYILIGLVILYFSRIFIITFTSEKMFETALNTRYLSSIYNIQFLITILSIIFITNYIKKDSLNWKILYTSFKKLFKEPDNSNKNVNLNTNNNK